MFSRKVQPTQPVTKSGSTSKSIKCHSHANRLLICNLCVIEYFINVEFSWFVLTTSITLLDFFLLFCEIYIVLGNKLTHKQDIF